MQFIRLPKLIDIVERVVPELVSDWMNSNSIHNITICFVQQDQANMLISWVIKWSKSGMPHWHSYVNFTHSIWDISDFSKHDLFQTIPGPGTHKRTSLSLEYISSVPFQAWTSYVKIPEWGEHSSNRRMQCLISIFHTFWVTDNQPKRIQACSWGVWQLSFGILLIVRFNFQACWSPEELVNWLVLDAQMTGTIGTPVGSWFCLSPHQSWMFTSLCNRWLSVSARCTSVKSRWACYGRCAKRNCIHLKISLYWNVLIIREWYLIQQSSLSHKLSSERSFHRASAAWNDLVWRLCSPHLRCWSIHMAVYFLHD